MKKKFLLFLVSLISLFVKCTDELEDITSTEVITSTSQVNESNTDLTDNSSSQNNQTIDSFDHKGMLINWVDNIIVPSINNFDDSLAQLKEALTTFLNDPTLINFKNLKEIYFISYSKWQYVEMFDIGIAEEIYFKNRINIYPANVQNIENNISSKNYDLDESLNFSSQGFSALDYLLNGIADNENLIIAKYSDKSLNYGVYLNEIIDQMISLTYTVKYQWDGDYRNTFIESTDNTSTSSINMVVNDFVYYFEKGYRANKFGIPAGVFSGAPLPDRVEAYYGEEYSKLLALEAGNAIEQFFNGKSSEDLTNIGLSLKHYLDYIESNDDEKLSTRINDQLNTAKDKIISLNNNFKLQVEQDNTQMLSTYDAIQKTVVMLKVDMLQKLNISVDYADADGD